MFADSAQTVDSPTQSLLATTLRRTMATLFKPVASPHVSIALQRRWLEALSLSTLEARGVSRTEQNIGGVRCLVYQPEKTDRTVIFLHGGAYVVGSPESHKSITSHLSRYGNAQVIVPDYRLAPEHPCPAAIDDAVAVYRTVLEKGADPQSLSLAGDSAGGGLCLSAALALKGADLPLPSSLVLISPWVDLTQDQLYDTDREVMLQPAWISKAARLYGGDRLERAECSPINGDLSGLPPTFIQVGAEEILLNDSHRLREALEKVGVPATLEVHPQRWHDFQLHAGLLQDANQALKTCAKFVDQNGNRS